MVGYFRPCFSGCHVIGEQTTVWRQRSRGNRTPWPWSPAGKTWQRGKASCKEPVCTDLNANSLAALFLSPFCPPFRQAPPARLFARCILSLADRTRRNWSRSRNGYARMRTRLNVRSHGVSFDSLPFLPPSGSFAQLLANASCERPCRYPIHSVRASRSILPR